METTTGETGEVKLEHASGEATRFYQRLAGPALIGMESTGNCQWFVEMATTAGHDVWVGDAAKIRASDVRRQKHDRRDAALILKLLLEGRFPRIWTPSGEEKELSGARTSFWHLLARSNPNGGTSSISYR